MATLYFEDFTPGRAFQLGRHQMTRDEIVEFAQRFDPQPFHLDEEGGAASPFGGLIASGWHTASVFMRLYVDAVLSDAASMGSPGLSELRWRHPVRPGDVVTGEFAVEAVEPSSRRPDRGTVHFRGHLVNQEGETVLTMAGRGYFQRRESDGSADWTG
jgi:acyl dehydratase